jgi:hypothetical protein
MPLIRFLAHRNASKESWRLALSAQATRAIQGGSVDDDGDDLHVCELLARDARAIAAPISTFFDNRTVRARASLVAARTIDRGQLLTRYLYILERTNGPMPRVLRASWRIRRNC